MPQGLYPVLVTLALLLVPGVAAAKVRALVVGVSTYTSADLAGAALPGTAADAGDVAAIVAGGDAEVTLLTGREARAAAIRVALQRLVASARPGDRAVIFLAGHGVQAPARGHDEPDGLDEWFLAADAGRWDARLRALPGAIRDDELGEAISAIRARGADLWLIVDACSGGGLARGGAGVPRQIDPGLLGLPGVSRGARLDQGGMVDLPALPGAGRLVMFQAARPGAIAWERTLPDATGARRRGLFTWALIRAWREIGVHGSFADLAAAAERERVTAGPPGGPALVTGDITQPVLFAGTARDLLAVTQAAAPLAASLRIGIGRAGARCPGTPPTALAAIGEGPVVVRGCHTIAVEVTSLTGAQRITAWYRDAAGDTVALTGVTAHPITPTEPDIMSFVVSPRDPQTGSRLPTGREYLILLSEDGTEGRVVPFDTGE